MLGAAVALLALTLLGAEPAMGQGTAAGSWRDQVRRLVDAPHLLTAPGGAKKVLRTTRPGGRRSLASLTTLVAESEPNNSVATADSVALGDRATGAVDPVADLDVWLVDLTAGQFFSVDVDAAEDGSPLDPVLSLIAPDGMTVLDVSDDFDAADSRISFHITTSGRYYVVLRAFGGGGGPDFTYAINFGTVTCSPGGTEQEPNGTPGTASPVQIGGDASGEICTGTETRDVDYWAFTAQAGETIELDVDAQDFRLLVDPTLALFASDGTTRLAFNNDADGADSRLQFSITTTGTYFATVAAAPGSGESPFPYVLHVRAITPGPGDPITVLAEGLGLPLGLAVGNTGDLFVGDITGNRILRVSGQGVVSIFAAVPSPLGLTLDAFGHLVVVSSDGKVYRVTPQGQVASFITDAGVPFWVAVGLDGRIWLTDLADGSLRRYSPTGRFETRFDVSAIGGIGAGPLAIGPSGEPYFSNGIEIWKLVNGQPQRVFRDGQGVWGFAFDVAGNIYTGSQVVGLVKLFDATGTVVADTFAVGPDTPQALAFGRDGTGATVARLFAADTRAGRLIEMNPAAVAHRGLPVGFVPPPVSLDAATAGLLGAGGLSPAEVQYLDALGNHNGRYDVGDLQAYLRTLDALSGAATSAARQRQGSNR